MATVIDIKALTNNTKISTTHEVTGDGYFDILMVAVTQHIKAQYEAGRIRGEDYANVYLAATQAALKHSVDILLQKPQIEINLDLLKEQITTEQMKQKVLERQKKGFDDDYKQKVARQTTEMWGVGFSVAGTNSTVNIPTIMNQLYMDNLLKSLILDSGLSYTNVPIK